MFDRHQYEALEAEAYLKGEAKGLADGMEKGLEKGAASEREKIVHFLRSQNVSDDVISAMLALK